MFLQLARPTPNFPTPASLRCAELGFGFVRWACVAQRRYLPAVPVFCPCRMPSCARPAFATALCRLLAWGPRRTLARARSSAPRAPAKGTGGTLRRCRAPRLSRTLFASVVDMGSARFDAVILCRRDVVRLSRMPANIRGGHVSKEDLMEMSIISACLAGIPVCCCCCAFGWL